jgi:3'(2'), 5'-bisphosphate nucleotidase
VYAPALDEMYYGVRGVGAFVCDGDSRVPIAVRRPAVSPLRVAAIRSHLDLRSSATIDRMGDTTLLGMGSSLKFCRMSEARLDVYPRFAPTCEWDTAAGQCVLESAGGVVLTLDGRPLRYNHKESLLNPDFLALGDAELPWRDWVYD